MREKTNKKKFLKILKEKLNCSEEECNIINEVLENHFIIGKTNQEKIEKELVEKLGISEEKADDIYNAAMETIGSEILIRITHPFQDMDK